MDILKLQQRLADFADERDWNQFHNPKNIVMALSVEASELLEIFQWLDLEQSAEIMHSDAAQHVREEIADVMIYLVRLSDKLGVDLEQAVNDKIIQNSKKHPASKS